jgi:hypothetical protein
MFEQEIEMEQRQSSVVPLLLIVAMILTIVGVAGYYLIENRKVLSSADAAKLVAAELAKGGPSTIHFQAGIVTASVQERPHDPNYRLLEKAGLLTIGKDQDYGRRTPIILTAAGRKTFEELPGVSRTTDAKEKSEAYVVPVAERVLVGTPQVTMNGIGRAKVEFTWEWQPNRIGEFFEASGPLVKSFNTWDRATLIDKYGAKFYHGQPTKATLLFAKEGGEWHATSD